MTEPTMKISKVIELLEHIKAKNNEMINYIVSEHPGKEIYESRYVQGGKSGLTIANMEIEYRIAELKDNTDYSDWTLEEIMRREA